MTNLSTHRSDLEVVAGEGFTRSEWKAHFNVFKSPLLRHAKKTLGLFDLLVPAYNVYVGACEYVRAYVFICLCV